MGTWHFIGLPSSSWDGGTTGTGDLSSILLCEMVGAALEKSRESVPGTGGRPGRGGYPYYTLRKGRCSPGKNPGNLPLGRGDDRDGGSILIIRCEMVGAALGKIPGISPRDRGTTETGDLSLFYVAKFSVRPWEESPGICPWDGGTTGTGKFCLNRVTVDIYR